MTLNGEERAMVATVRQWVEDAVKPVARELEAANAYPTHLINDMKTLGVFGLLVPPEFGGTGVSALCFARITEELARGWMSLAGAMGSHSVIVSMIREFGTPEQKDTFLPGMAEGSIRAAMALTEPGGGSDLQGMTTKAVKTGDEYLVNGEKTWITNAQHASLIALLVKTDPQADPPHKGISVLLAQKGPGMEISEPLKKLGYKGIESCSVRLSDYRVPASMVLGENPGQGFSQMMRGLEIGRVQVACRAIGVAQAAYEEAIEYAQVRESFGKPIWQHQAIGHLLANMATSLSAARGLVRTACESLDSGTRSDLEAAMAKLFASEMCREVVFDAMRIFGSYGYSPEANIERYYRDAPLMIIGEGTNEVQRNVIAQRLIARETNGRGR